jgi:hypothetical protein
MPRQIIRQPDGLFAVWSTVVDGFVMIDASPQEIIDEWVAEQELEIGASVERTVDALKRGEKPYHQFTMTFDEALELYRHIHGKPTSLEQIRKECADLLPLPQAGAADEGGKI